MRNRTAAPRLLFFGAYDQEYPRNLVIRKGWRKLGLVYSECRVGTRRKVHTRYPSLLYRFIRGGGRGDLIYVPEFRHKDVPLAWMISRLTGMKVLFDPLVSRYETKVLDRGDAREGSAQAWHNLNLDRISFGMSDLLLSDTAAHADYYHESFGVERAKIGVVPVGYDEDAIDALPQPQEREVIEVLFYGSFLPLHGIDTIIRAAALLADEPFRFRIVGEGQTRKGMLRMAEEHRLARVEFMPSVRFTDLGSMISEADVVLGIFGTTPKASMVGPNKVYQALAAGRAVVTADTPAIQEFFRDREHLMTVPRGDPEALAGLLRELASDRSLRLRLSDVGGSYVRSHFNSRRIAETLLGVIGEIDF